MRQRGSITRFLLLLSLIPGASALMALPCHARQVDLAPYVQYLEDPSGELTLAQVSSKAYGERFVSAERKGDLNFGYSKSTFWLRAPLGTRTLDNANGLLEVGFYSLEHIELFAPGKQGLSGGRHERAVGTWPYRHTVFPVRLNDVPEYFYLRVRSSGSMTIPLTLWDAEEFDLHSQRLYLGLGLYYGALLALVLYNILLFISLRERNFILYSSFAALIGLGIVSGNGIGHQFLWPHWTEWSTLFSTLALGLAEVFAILFSQSFLNTRRHTPRLHRLLWAIVAVVAVSVVGAPFVGISAHVAEVLLSLFGILIALLISGASVVALRHGERSARFYLVAWGVLWTGTIVAGLRNFGLVPTNTVTAYAVQLSSAFEMLLLSFALADRIHLEREKKERAQAQADAAKQSLVETLQSSEQRLEGLVRERTERLNQALENEQRVLERYVRFGALISHEFRNPLAVIKSQVTSMAMASGQGALPPGQRLGAIRSAAARLETMFEEWLQSDRLSQNHVEAHPTLIELPKWLSAIAADCVDYYSDHRVVLRLDGCATMVLADEPMLRVAVHNLVDNAAKYSAAGTTITIESARREGLTGILVSDQGAGVSDRDRQRIYAEYFRANPTGSSPGFGLGLSFVNRIVQLHGGTIELESEVGKGSRFGLWLPEPSGKAVRLAPRPLSMLLVEDVKGNGLIMRAMLRKEGHTVTLVENGEAALAALERGRFDLVLMDLQMPGMDGFETTRKLRGTAERRLAQTPVFALTANVLSHTEAACLQAGMDEVLGKPLRMEELNAKLVERFGGEEPTSSAV